jgi:hypothetical protein
MTHEVKERKACSRLGQQTMPLVLEQMDHGLLDWKMLPEKLLMKHLLVEILLKCTLLGESLPRCALLVGLLLKCTLMEKLPMDILLV